MLEVRTNNMMGVNTQRQGISTNNAIREARERLSSSSRVSSTADNSAELALNVILESQMRSLATASRNVNSGNSMVRTAEASINQTGELLNHARELTVQAANDTLSTENRNAIYREISDTLAELDTVSETAQFNTRNLLDGSGNLFFQAGENSEQQINAVINEISTESLGLENFTELYYNASNDSTNLGAPVISTLIERIDSGLAQVGEARTELAAIENRLNFANENINIVRENLTNANSRLADADTAFEAMRIMQEMLLEEAQTTMLVQANQHQGAVMRLLA